MQAVPVGLVFFGGMVLAFMRRRVGNQNATKQYPALAARLGLAHRPSRYQTGVGTLSGQYQGFAVVVDPDDQRRIRVKFRGQPRVDLRNYELPTPPPQDMGTLFSRDKHFDAFFKTRYVGSEERARLEDLERPSEMLAPFRQLRELKQLAITESGVSAVFDFGNPPHIPASVVEALLPPLVQLARLVEDPEEAAAGADREEAPVEGAAEASEEAP
jgi:hypothetical protein